MATSYSLEEIWRGTFTFLTLQFSLEDMDMASSPSLEETSSLPYKGEGMATSLFFIRGQEVKVSI